MLTLIEEDQRLEFFDAPATCFHSPFRLRSMSYFPFLTAGRRTQTPRGEILNRVIIFAAD